MAWSKTIDGDLLNLDSGVYISMYSGEVRICHLNNNETFITACSGEPFENRKYMSDFEKGLIDSGEIIIEPI